MNPKPTTDWTPPVRLADGGAATTDERAIAGLISGLPGATPDDLAVERVWRRVTSPAARQARVPGWLWAPAAAVVAVVVAVIGLRGLLRPDLAVQVAASSGGVFASRLAGDWRAVQSGDSVDEASRLRTDASGLVLARIPGVAAVWMDEGSDVGVERVRPGTLLRLGRGKLTARVSKRAPDAPFLVETDRYTVKVVGTLFSVEQGPGDRTTVSVREGVVEVSDGAGRVERVAAGQRWSSATANERSADTTPDAVTAVLEAGLAGEPAEVLQSQIAAVSRARSRVEERPASGQSAVQVPSTPSLEAPQVAAREASPSRPAPVVPQSRAEKAPVESGPSTLQVAPSVDTATAPVEAPSVAPVAGPIASSAPDEGPYALGLALEAKGDFQGAARELARAADDGARDADLALYALGRLAQRRLHDAVRARLAFTHYRERYPRGALLPEVDFAMLEIEVETHAVGDALADSARFLSVHPASERASEVRLLRGNLLRDARRCGEAIVEYEAVAAGPQADDALYSRAYCQREVGDRAGAAATLRSYLDRFPSGAHRAAARDALDRP